jgi:hypothetical protein
LQGEMHLFLIRGLGLHRGERAGESAVLRIERI